jgi:exosortase
MTVHRWTTQSEYSHGFLVPLFSAYLLWARRNTLLGAVRQPSWWGLPLVVAGLLLHFLGAFFFVEWLSQVALLPSLAGLSILGGGRSAWRWSSPAILFLLFMMPLPFNLETALASPLQRIATVASTFFLQTLGFVAFSQGNVIHLGEFRIGIVEACNGLSMLVVFVALAAAVVLVFPLARMEKAVVMLSAIPIALLSNIVRIVATALLYQVVSAEAAQTFFHDVAGWLMMLFALALLWMELRLLAWLLIPVAPADGEALRAFVSPSAARVDPGTVARPQLTETRQEMTLSQV